MFKHVCETCGGKHTKKVCTQRSLGLVKMDALESLTQVVNPADHALDSSSIPAKKDLLENKLPASAQNQHVETLAGQQILTLQRELAELTETIMRQEQQIHEDQTQQTQDLSSLSPQQTLHLRITLFKAERERYRLEIAHEFEQARQLAETESLEIEKLAKQVCALKANMQSVVLQHGLFATHTTPALFNINETTGLPSYRNSRTFPSV